MSKTSKSLLATVCILLLALIIGAYVFFVTSARTKNENIELKAATPTITLVRDTTRLPGKTLPPFKHAYLNKPDSLVEARQLDSVSFYYHKAALLFEKEGNWEGYVWSQNQVGKNQIRLRDYDDVLPYLNNALDKGITYLGKEHRFVSNTYYFLGEYFHYTKQPDEALEDFNQSLAIRLKLFGELSTYVADVYNTIGNVHQYIRLDYQQAEEYYTKSLEIREKFVQNTPYKIVLNYYSLATANISKGDYDKALSYAHEALRIIEALPYSDWPFLESCNFMVASIYTAKGQYEESVNYLNKAIYLNTTYKGRESELASYYHDLGKTYQASHQFPKAVAYFSKALHIHAHSTITDSVNLADSYQYLGSAYKNIQQFDTALYNFQKCLQIRKSYFSSKHRQTSVILQLIGGLYQESGQLDSALVYFQRAIIAGTSSFAEKDINNNPVVADIGNNFYLFETLSSKAAVLKQHFHQTGKTKSLLTALHCYQLADTLRQLYYQRYDREDSKLFFTGNQQRLYEGAISCAFLLSQLTHENKYSLQVLHWMEKSKASILFETFREMEANNQAGIPDSIRELERNLKIDMAFYQHQLEEEIHKPKPQQVTLQQLRTSIFKTSRQQELLIDQLSRSHPSYFQIKYQNNIEETTALPLYADKTGNRLIEYFWGDSAVYGLGLSGNSIKLIKIDKTPQLMQAVLAYLAQISHKPDLHTADKDFVSFTESAYYLYNTLLAPLLHPVKANAADLPARANTKLTIIPDGPLTSIPFEALLTRMPAIAEANYRNLAYLIQNHQVSYAYSASLLVYNHNNQKNEKYHTVGLLAFSYSKDTMNGETELAGTARELKAIASYMDGIFLKGDEATEGAFKEMAPQFSILHLAIHGKADQESYLSNHLLFKQQDNQVQDGLLYPYELYNLNLQAKLTVLSACETGVGKLYKGEGVYSIARGFAYAGCPSIVMSLWKANDQTTADIMGEFYKELSQGSEIDNSLHLAKMAYLQKGDHITAHPAYWAAFVPLGNMEPVVENRQYTYLVAGGTGIFLIILAFLVMLYISVTSHKKKLLRFQ